MLCDFEMEELERLYFEHIRTFLLNDINNLIININSRLDIIDDWATQFKRTSRKGFNTSDLESGAERVFHHFFSPLFKFPNSSPIGSDLMYRCYDAFVHIDIKTALLNNTSDYKGKVNLAQNQTSYSIPNNFSANLPTYYKFGGQDLPCLTYVIQIVHENFTPKLKAILLICVPNGQLFGIYGKSIVAQGKTKDKSFRYHYASEPRFKELCNPNKTLFRVELLCLSSQLNQSDITNVKNFNLPTYIIV